MRIRADVIAWIDGDPEDCDRPVTTYLSFRKSDPGLRQKILYTHQIKIDEEEDTFRDVFRALRAIDEISTDRCVDVFLGILFTEGFKAGIEYAKKKK